MSDEIMPWTQVKTSFANRSKTEETAWLEVPGGRLYKHWIAHSSGCSVGLTFVPTNDEVVRLRKEQARLMEEVRGLRIQIGDRDAFYA